ncbi:MAG: sulfotransferase family protein [Acidimicrobiales bacterium]|nr:sulfotransferase family protein [Acidimicrobiales bacterium]
MTQATTKGPHMFLTLWATPRSTSTAFEWMMRQRGDFACHHEPWNELYYYGEDRVSQRDADVVAKPGHNYASVWNELSTAGRDDNVFVKDFVYSVGHTLTDEMLAEMNHSFLIRDPKRVVQGLAKHWPDCSWEEVGFESLHRLLHRIADRDGTPPPVMFSGDLLDDPAGTARAYCDAVGIPFIAEALEWEAGDRSEVSWYGEGTGPWHDNLRESTGIQKPKTTYPPLEDNPRLFELYERALPLYDDMHQFAFAPISDS